MLVGEFWRISDAKNSSALHRVFCVLVYKQLNLNQWRQSVVKVMIEGPRLSFMASDSERKFFFLFTDAGR
jgi:hypothetical protein